MSMRQRFRKTLGLSRVFRKRKKDLSHRIGIRRERTNSYLDKSSSTNLPDILKNTKTPKKEEPIFTSTASSRSRSTPRQRRDILQPLKGGSPSGLKRNSSIGEKTIQRTGSKIRLRKIDSRTELRSLKRYSDVRGLTGMDNLGNTNSSVQCLSNIPPLRDFFLSDKYKFEINRKNKTRGKLAKTYAKLMKKLWSEDVGNSISSYSFKQMIQRYAPMFYGYRQHDAGEFIKFLLDGLHEDLNRITVSPKYKELKDKKNENVCEKSLRYWVNFKERNDSFVSGLFSGQLKSELKCLKCGFVSTSFDPFYEISISIPSKKERFFQMFDDRSYHLSDCFDKFTEDEKLLGNEKPFCSKCKKHTISSKRMSIFRLPKVLVVLLKRFNNRRRKLVNEIIFPIKNLNIQRYVDKNSDQKTNGVYNLTGVINHIGSLYGGHYTSFALNSTIKKWVYYNDSRVKLISSRTVQSSSAYVLFYLQKDLYKNGYKKQE